MENPLSQSEIDALLRSILPTSGEDLFQTKATGVRSYDFRRPGKFNKDLLRTLVMVHDNFARLLQTFFSAQLRTRVQVAVRTTSQYPFSEFVQLLPNPAVVVTFSLKPLPGICLLEISQNVAYAIVDKVFGGPGSDVQPQRGLSEIELGVVQRTVQDMFTPLQEAWRNVAAIKPALESIETNPMFLQTAAPSEVLAAITVGVQIGEHMGHMTLAFPYSTVEPVLARLSPHSWLASDRPPEEGELETLKQQVQEAPVELTAILGKARMSVGEFMNLQVGDVITLGTTLTAEIPVYIGNLLMFQGRPGVSRDHMSVLIRRLMVDSVLDPQSLQMR